MTLKWMIKEFTEKNLKEKISKKLIEYILGKKN